MADKYIPCISLNFSSPLWNGLPRDARARLYQYLARDLAVRCQRRIGPKCGPCPRPGTEAEEEPAARRSRPSTPPPTPAQGSMVNLHAHVQS